jgi:hypothetical protein
VWALAALDLGPEIGRGASGHVRRGAVDGRDAAIKIFELGQVGESALRDELAIYDAMLGEQGRSVPRVLAHGLLDHCFRPFLALSLEGPSLNTDGV